jgi:hypothetical protein
LDGETAAERFITFLRSDGGAIRANRCLFKDNKWFGARESELLAWPKAELQ